MLTNPASKCSVSSAGAPCVLRACVLALSWVRSARKIHLVVVPHASSHKAVPVTTRHHVISDNRHAPHLSRESTPGIRVMWSTFAKYRKGESLQVLRLCLNMWSSFSGSSEKAEPLNNVKISSKSSDLGASDPRGHKVRFDTEDERSGGGGRRLRGRNIFAHSDVEVGSSVAASVVSDNTHLYRRSRSAVSRRIYFVAVENIMIWRTCYTDNFVPCSSLRMRDRPRFDSSIDFLMMKNCWCLV